MWAQRPAQHGHRIAAEGSGLRGGVWAAAPQSTGSYVADASIASALCPILIRLGLASSGLGRLMVSTPSM
jgi:hypothetical protein